MAPFHVMSASEIRIASALITTKNCAGLSWCLNNIIIISWVMDYIMVLTTAGVFRAVILQPSTVHSVGENSIAEEPSRNTQEYRGLPHSRECTPSSPSNLTASCSMICVKKIQTMT